MTGQAAVAPERTRAGWPGIAAVVGLVVVQRLVHWYLVGALGPEQWTAQLTRWDGGWYREIALDGYNLGWPGKRSNLAFFPAYPLAGRAVAVVLPGHDVELALLLVGLVSSVVVAWGLVRLGEALHSARMGFCLALLWPVLPRSFVAVMPYSEAMFTAALVWSLVWMARGRWWAAAVCCAVAGATRPIGAALVATVAGPLLWLLLRRVRSAVRRVPAGTVGWTTQPQPVPGMLSLVGAGLLACFGFLGTVAHVAHRWGSWDGYLAVQASWNMRMGNPLATLAQWNENFVLWSQGQLGVSLTGTLFFLPLWTALLVVSVVMCRTRPTWRLAVLTSGLDFLVMACAQDYFNSKERFLLPAIGLLLPVGWALATGTRRLEERVRRRTGSARPVQLALGLGWLAAAVAAGVFGDYIILHKGIAP